MRIPIWVEWLRMRRMFRIVVERRSLNTMLFRVVYIRMLKRQELKGNASSVLSTQLLHSTQLTFDD